jgi:hypothetical protein
MSDICRPLFVVYTTCPGRPCIAPTIIWLKQTPVQLRVGATMLTRTTPKLMPVPRDPQGWLCEAAKHHQSVSHESAYQLARRAGWDIEQLACPGGITDPHLRRHHHPPWE